MILRWEKQKKNQHELKAPFKPADDSLELLFPPPAKLIPELPLSFNLDRFSFDVDLGSLGDLFLLSPLEEDPPPLRLVLVGLGSKSGFITFRFMSFFLAASSSFFMASFFSNWTTNKR